MPTFEIVCLANSRKWNGRCVAGLRTDGKGWLRPVGSNPEGVLHPHHYMLPDDTEPQLGDVLRVHCSRPHPQPHHPEDWIVMSLPWERVTSAAESRRQEWLRPYLTQGPQLLGSAGDRVAAETVQAHPVTHSLALIAPQSLHWHITLNSKGERRTRVVFTLDDAEYDLSLTDPLWEQRVMHLKTGIHPRRMADIAEDAEVWLTISLGEPFAAAEGGKEFCYKLVAGVLVLTAEAGGASAETLNSGRGMQNRSVPGANRKKTNAPAPTYVGVTDLSGYPDPFADDMQTGADDLQTVAVTEGRPTVTASVTPAALPALHATPSPEIAFPKTEAVPIAPESASAKESRRSRKQSSEQAVKSNTNATPKTNDRANGKWDNPLDKSLWQKQMARTRHAVVAAPLSWTEDEDALLQRLASEGEAPEDIALQMGRVLDAVCVRLETLGMN